VRTPARAVGFGLSSEQCELLVAFEATGSLAALAELVGKDVSVVSRQLSRLAQSLPVPVIEKHGGKWRLTATGRRMNAWTRDAALAQNQILDHQTVLRIASTREFGARILAPALASLLAGSPDVTPSIVTAEHGVEQLLLGGQADIGFDCGRPEDPALRFKTVKAEEFAVVIAPRLLGGRSLKEPAELLAWPHLQYQRAQAPRLLQLPSQVPNVYAVFNDIAALREAAVAALGWAVLPRYSVRRELDAGALVQLPGWDITREHFGVWWVRGQKAVEPWVQRAIKWLETQPI
jgi:LysR family glycine cleavage system transcriptional activator